MNTSYNYIDRHALKNPDQRAQIYESTVANNTQGYTYGELLANVSRLAGVLQKFGVEKGDGVIIYMPMIPEAVFSMLACARIGAIHSVVFGGFGGSELAGRVVDLKPKVILSAPCGIEATKIADYKTMLDQALNIAKVPNVKKIIVQREMHKIAMIEGEDSDFHQELAAAKPVGPVPVNGSDYLYILYTSGIT